MTSHTAVPIGRPQVVAVAVGLGMLGYVLLFLREVNETTFDSVGAFAVVPILLVGWALLARRLARGQSDPWVGRLILWSVGAKFLAAVARYLVSIAVYGGLFDAGRYDRTGKEVAGQIWRGDLLDVPFSLGTRAMEVITGLVYAVVGAAPFTGFVAFAFLAWLGQYFFLEAFRLWLPDEHVRRYAALVLLSPTVIFWPASIGKESWMLLTLGAASLGIARFLHSRIGFGLATAGLVGASLVRPHMTIMIVVAAVGALVLGSRGLRGSTRWLALALLAIGGVLLASRFQNFFALDDLSVDTLTQFNESVASRTASGGSEFSNVSVTNPLLWPFGFVSTMLRPFPWEAGNLQALAVSFEGIALVVLSWRIRNSFRRIPTLIRSNPWVAFCVVFVVVFVIGFSNFNNFGLLARERAQVLPMLLVVLSLRQSSETPSVTISTHDLERERVQT